MDCMTTRKVVNGSSEIPDRKVSTTTPNAPNCKPMRAAILAPMAILCLVIRLPTAQNAPWSPTMVGELTTPDTPKRMAIRIIPGAMKYDRMVQ
jgi:hypothetical protein